MNGRAATHRVESGRTAPADDRAAAGVHRVLQGLRLGAALALVLLTTACSGFDARMALKEGNRFYKEGKYGKALESYAKVQGGNHEIQVKTALGKGYAYMAQYRFGSKKDIDRKLAHDAVEAFDAYLKILTPADEKDTHLATREKVEDWIIILLADSDQYELAIKRLEDDLKKKPNDPAILRGIASTYDKWGKPTIALEYFQKWAATFPKDASPQVAIAAYAWNMSYRSGMNMEPIERNRWVDNGLVASDAALKIDPRLFEGLTYKNLLLRERSKLRIDPDEVASLQKAANAILDEAKKIRDEQKAAAEAEKAKATPSPSPKVH